MDNVFDAIKSALGIVDVVAQYGVDVKRGNKATCPFHDEKTPSFIIYPETNSWHCFGCGAGGSVIDFVMRYCGMNALDAAKTLDEEHGLGLFEKRSSTESMQRISEQRMQNQVNKELLTVFDAFVKKAYFLLCDYLNLLEDWKIKYAPKTHDELDAINPFYIKACSQFDYIIYLLNGLEDASYEEQISFYNSHRKEIINNAKWIKQYAKNTNAYKSA